MQKFKYGDMVRVTDKLPSHMVHFGHSGEDAIVIHSYCDVYGVAGSGGGYRLQFRNGSSSSWWHDDQLTLVSSGNYELMHQWAQKK